MTTFYTIMTEKNNHKRNILLIGPAPQNIGGISIHLRRLVGLLKDEFTFSYVDEGHKRYKGVFNLRSLNLAEYYRLLLRADIVHIHSGVFILRCFHIINSLLFRKKTIVTVHRDPRIEGHLSVTRRLLKHCDHAILVNREGYEALKTKGKCQYHLLPAFLPPLMESEKPLPEEITDWINNFRSSHDNPIICCSNAWNLVFHNGEDLYGLDICIRAMNFLISKGHLNIGLVFVVASNTERPQVLDEYKTYIHENRIEANILIWEENLSFVRLIQSSNLVLRTTNTDGDAISLREALYYGKPVIASDVVKRPAGTILFKSRDYMDLTNKILNMNEETQETSASSERIDYKNIYMNIYNK